MCDPVDQDAVLFMGRLRDATERHNRDIVAPFGLFFGECRSETFSTPLDDRRIKYA
jgi:hypothetical protein